MLKLWKRIHRLNVVEMKAEGRASSLSYNIDFPSENLIDDLLLPYDEMKHLLVEKEMSS